MPLDPEAIRKRCEAATKEPWWRETFHGREGDELAILGPLGDPKRGRLIATIGPARSGRTVDLEDEANIAHMVWSRTDIPALLTDRKELQAEIARLREAGKELANGNRLCDLMQDEDLQRLCAVFGVTVEIRMGAALEEKP